MDSMQAGVSQAGPGAIEDRRKAIAIVAAHAGGHNALDRYGIPRVLKRNVKRLHEYTIAERIELLAERGGIAPKPRRQALR